MDNKKMTRRVLFYVSMFTWGLPYTIIGAIIFAFSYLFLAKRVNKIVIVEGRIVAYVDKLPGAISLGLFVMGETRLLTHYPNILRHELGHTVQAAMFGGILFIILIAIPSFIRAAMFGWLEARHLKKYGEKLEYDSIWFEGQATEFGDLYFPDVA